MNEIQESRDHAVQDTQVALQAEEDPHRAAIEDNPADAKVSAQVWIAIFSMALSFGPAVGTPFTSVASIVVQITSELGGESKMAWVIGAWSLATACSFSLGGPLSDVFGRRNLILAGQIIVVIGNIVGGTAQNIESLIAAETLIGLGTGMIFVSYAGVPEMLPNKWRSLGLGILEGGITIPWGMITTILANALYEYATWRWLFYMGIIVEVVGFAGTAMFYWPTPHPRGDFDKSRWQQFKEIDWIGLFLFIGGLATCLVGLTWGGTDAYPWKSAGAIVPIVLGTLVVISAFVYDAYIPKEPMFPPMLLKMIRGYVLLLIILFVSGMNFHAMAALLPQGTLYMFTTDGIEIGVLSLPKDLISGVTGVLVPMLSHRLGYLKWQLAVGMALQTIFIGAGAATVNPNHKLAWAFVPGFGVPMFLLVTILAYAISSLHVPHSHLGVAMGLVGTFRSAGGAVGNAIFNTIFQDKFNSYSGEEIARAALANGLSADDLGAIIPGTIQYNLGVPGTLEGIQGMTPAIQDALRHAVRTAYGRAFQFVFYITIPFGVIAMICSVFVEDPTAYMTNHIQAAMQQKEASPATIKGGEEMARMSQEENVGNSNGGSVSAVEDVKSKE